MYLLPALGKPTMFALGNMYVFLEIRIISKYYQFKHTAARLTF